MFNTAMPCKLGRGMYCPSHCKVKSLEVRQKESKTISLKDSKIPKTKGEKQTALVMSALSEYIPAQYKGLYLIFQTQVEYFSTKVHTLPASI
jgi:hypothetical protein